MKVAADTLKMIYAQSSPKFLHLLSQLTLMLERKAFVSVIGQKEQAEALPAEFRSWPPAISTYSAMYSEQDLPSGAVKCKISLSAQVTGALAIVVPRNPSTMYVKGFTRYMKIQNLGSWVGPARTLRTVSIISRAWRGAILTRKKRTS